MKKSTLQCFNLCVCLMQTYGLSVSSSFMKSERRTPRSYHEAPCQPEDVHLSYGGSVTETTVMWSTKDVCDTLVHFADHPFNLNLQAAGSYVKLDSLLNLTRPFVHRVVLRDLSTSTTYYFRPYVNGSDEAETFYFSTPAATNESWSPNILMFTNLDSEKTRKLLLSEAQSGKYSSIFYVRDLEQKLSPGAGQADSSFLSSLKQAVAFVPFMTSSPDRKVLETGSPDGLYLYRHIFSLPGVDWPTPVGRLWYSFNIGPVHFVSYSASLILESDPKLAKMQRDWLVADLTEANRKRSETPWIIALGSQPMYCSESVLETDDCAHNTSKVRRGFEDILYHFAVDLVVEAGRYERTWPQYKGVVINKSYFNPRAPIELILGSGGDGTRSPTETPDSNATLPTTAFLPADWSSFRLADPSADSLGRLCVANSSHLYWELVSTTNQSVLDSFWIVQDSHGNFSLASLPHNISHQINQTIIAMGGKPGTYDFISGSTGSPDDVEGWSEYSLWLGLAVVGAVLVVIIGMVTIRSCVNRKKRRASRRWREDDRDGGRGSNFYTAASDSDTEDNDFEIDVYDKSNKQSSKLLTSY